MGSPIVGRRDELAAIQAFVDTTSDRPTALVIEGPPGIGKSTLWRAATRLVAERGWRRLTSEPSAAELDLAFAGLGDLFGEVVDDVLPALTPPRRRAMRAALLLDEVPAGPADPRALGVAVLDTLRRLADGPPVLVAVDDEQWLDGSTAGALSFALRRLDAPLHLLVARRPAVPDRRPGLDANLPATDVRRLAIGPLDVGAVRRLIEQERGRSVDRVTAGRIHDVAGGNPFHALEIAAALPDDIDPARPLPVPADLDQLTLRRLADLPTATRVALALVAAGGNTASAVLRDAGIAPEALAPALATHAVEVVGDDVRFTHPLLASLFLHRLTDAERRRAHATLAGLIDEPVAHAIHLALAAAAPDARVAAEVEAAAAVAERRGAVVAAAELAAHARRLTPLDDVAGLDRRSLVLAGRHLAAANPGAVGELIAPVLARHRSGPERARALLVAVDVEPEPERVTGVLRDALAHAVGDAEVECRVRRRLAANLRMRGDVVEAAAMSGEALDAARRLGDPALVGATQATLALTRLNLGDAGGFADAAAAAEVAARSTDPVLRAQVGTLLMAIYEWTGQHELLTELLAPTIDDLVERDELLARNALMALAFCHLAAGRLVMAADVIDRSQRLGAPYAETHFAAVSSFVRSLIEAHRGDLAAAQETAERARRHAESCAPRIIAGTEAALGLVAAWAGRPTVAIEHFATTARLRRENAVVDVSFPVGRAEHVDVLLTLGREAEAVALLDEWEAESERVDHRPALALARRCRGQVAAAAGEIDTAITHLEASAAAHAAVGDPFGEARSLLALGAVRRRDRQKRSAAVAIDESVRLFECCGAAGWAARAGAERGSIGGRRRETGITSAERRVADLVVAGHTNREIAGVLFLSERTVETHLSHVYAKLGVRSRTALVRTLVEE